MNALYLAGLLLCASLSATAACNVNEQQILGAWTNVGFRGAFEEIELELDGDMRSFNSWLHQRPEIIDASWKLKDCRLSIYDKQNRALSFSFSVSLNKDQLELRENESGRISTFKKSP